MSKQIPCINRKYDDTSAKGIIITRHLPDTIRQDSLYLTAEESHEGNVITMSNVIDFPLTHLSFRICKYIIDPSRILIFPLITMHISAEEVYRFFPRDDKVIREIIDFAVGIDEINIVQRLIFPELAILSIRDTLNYSLSPPIIPLVGNSKEVDKFLYKLSINPNDTQDLLDPLILKQINSGLVVLTASINKKFGLPPQYILESFRINSEVPELKFIHYIANLVIEFYDTPFHNSIQWILLGERDQILHHLLKLYYEQVTQLYTYNKILHPFSGLCIVELNSITLPSARSRILYYLKIKGELPTNAISMIYYCDSNGIRYTTFIDGVDSILKLDSILEFLNNHGLKIKYGRFDTITTDLSEEYFNSITTHIKKQIEYGL